MNLLTKAFATLLCALPFLASNTVVGQTANTETPYMNTSIGVHKNLPAEDKDHPYREIYRDTIEAVAKTQIDVRDSILDPMRVVTNKFGKNWFVFATAGVHTFQGDYSNTSKFTGTLSPDWGVGIGKWFTPGIALKVEFIKSESRGYTEYLTGHYGYGPIDLTPGVNGRPFRKMKTRWWDISGSVVLNLTRLFLGYEGYNSPRRMNQFMASFGFGGVHHLGYGHSYGSDNEWAGHVEFQYSRFFNPAKRFSLDVKLRGLLYQTNFDLEYGAYDNSSNKWDSNLGIDLGFTYYLGQGRANAWGTTVTQVYKRDFRDRDVLVYRERDIEAVPNDHKLKTITFYVFYPNNYSGRNDAPILPNSSVNAIDYLVGGIFTQKKYSDTSLAGSTVNSGARTTKLKYEDIPTESATNDFAIKGVQRGYEMSTSIPLSLSMQPAAMNKFNQEAGYYYAPIWDGKHEWHYRIDDATLGQQLISSSNYYEQETYGLNAHAGLPVIEANFGSDSNDILVSLADVYAALHGNTGWISQYADPKYAEKIREIFEKGIITIIEAHGCATSQDNYTGENAKQVGIERNKNLADYRAETVTKWMKGTPIFQDTKSIIYIDKAFTSSINTVTDPSTRGLNAKLNRCVKVRVQVIY